MWYTPCVEGLPQTGQKYKLGVVAAAGTLLVSILVVDDDDDGV
jgi:hypothetical protein